MTTTRRHDRAPDDGARGDDEREQLQRDRELDEILGELRVVLPGVTVLFAFLLTVPFTGDFLEVDTVDRAAYFLAFISAAVSMVFLVGESAYHRIVGKPYDKARLTRTAGRQAVVGIAALAFALTAVVFLVVKAPGAEVTAEELQSFVKERVATYKQVRTVQFIDEIPKSASGKILRRFLRDGTAA